MALLAFEDVRSSPVADLMDIAQRQKTASELNAAILASQSQVQPVHGAHALALVPHVERKFVVLTLHTTATTARRYLQWDDEDHKLVLWGA